VPDLAPYYVLPDANIWAAERLLQSSTGNAFLYAVTRSRSSILLPEVVELELTRVLVEMAERAVGRIRGDLALLRQLSGHRLSLTVPTPLAIEEGINERWKQLGGSVERTPFTHDQAKSGLQRVIQKIPPSGENNEQFRDCCIWHEAISKGKDRIVHLITGDRAFYENRNITAGLASRLRDELKSPKRNVEIHSSLADFLAKVEPAATAIDETAISDSITKAIAGEAKEIAAESDLLGRPGTTFQVGKAHPPRISGYATPKPSLAAISFEASFDLEQTVVEHGSEAHHPGTMTLKGVCSYDPTTRQVSDIEIREWSKDLKSPSGGIWGIASPDRTAVDRQYSPGRMRLIS
jgi:hypothetical protein